MNLGTGLTAYILALLVASVPANVAIAADNQAKGTLTYQTYSVTLKYAWLVKGPYERDPGKTIRRLILSANDIGAKLQACKTMSCASGQVTEGMTVDFDTPPRLDYWVAVNSQKVQYSYGAMPEAFVARANDAGHLAGQLIIDDVAAGGPKVDAEFDVTVFKEFKSD
jgi:hypothetical protein